MKHSPDEKPVLKEKYPSHFPDAFIPDNGFAGQKFSPAHHELQAAKIEKADTKRLQEGIRLFLQKDWERALRELRVADADGFSDEQKTELAYYLGLCYSKLERFDDALIYLEQVIAGGGDPLRIYQCRMAMAYIYITKGRARMAEYELKRLLNAGFESVPLYNTLAYASYSQRRFKNAVEYYEKALDLDKDNATALNSMGFILVDTGMDLVKGLRFCRKAVEQKPQNPVYLDSLGWACFKSGETAEARSLLRRAMELAPKEKEIQEHFMLVTGEAL